MTEMFGEAWPPMSVPDLAPDDDDDDHKKTGKTLALTIEGLSHLCRIARKSSCKFSQLLHLAQTWDNLRKYDAKKL